MTAPAKTHVRVLDRDQKAANGTAPDDLWAGHPFTPKKWDDA